jgi:hypothetical protein
VEYVNLYLYIWMGWTVVKTVMKLGLYSREGEGCLRAAGCPALWR